MLLLRIADINRNPLTDSFPENFYCVLPYIVGVVQTFVRAKQHFRQYRSIPHQVTECRWPHAFWHFVINPCRMRFPIHPYSDFEFFRIFCIFFQKFRHFLQSKVSFSIKIGDSLNNFAKRFVICRVFPVLNPSTNQLTNNTSEVLMSCI